MENIQFRLAAEQDRAAILAIAAQIWDGDDYLPDVIDDWLRPGSAQLLVAMLDERLVGLGRFDPVCPGYVWLEGLRVDPAFQRQGIARALTGRMAQMADASGADVIALSTYIDNVASQRVSAAFGFKPVAGFAYAEGKLPDVEPHAQASPRVVEVAREEAAAFIHASRALSAAAGYLPHSWRFFPFGRCAETALARMGRLVGIRDGERLAALLCCGDHTVHGPASFSIDFLEGEPASMTELARHALTFARAERYLEAMVPCRDGAALPSVDALRAAGFNVWNEGRPDVFVYERRRDDARSEPASRGEDAEAGA